MSMTSESEDQMGSKGSIGSPSLDEASGGGNCGVNGPLKKGPWTSAEDAILVEYVTKHGEGNWNAVQKHSGLARCGKSCRLRWANHLRPDLKMARMAAERGLRLTECGALLTFPVLVEVDAEHLQQPIEDDVDGNNEDESQELLGGEGVGETGRIEFVQTTNQWLKFRDTLAKAMFIEYQNRNRR